MPTKRQGAKKTAPKKATPRKIEVSYRKFEVTDPTRHAATAKPAADAASPALAQLQSKLKTKINVAKLQGKVDFKRAVPKTKSMDGSSTSRRLIVKNGKVVGAQG